MIDHFRMLRLPPDDDMVFDPSRDRSNATVEDLGFNVRVHRRRHSPRLRHGHEPDDRIYLEPVPCQPCSWEEVLRACEVLVDLRAREQDIHDRRERARVDREKALRILGRFLRWVGSAP